MFMNKSFIVLAAVFVLGVDVLSAADSRVKRIHPPALHPPHGYTQVIAVASGRTVYIAGQVPLDVKPNLVGRNDFEAQTRQVFENIKAAIAAVGATFSDVVTMATYVTDISQIKKYRKVRDEYMTSNLPTASLVEVKSLFRPDVMIEVSAIAVIHESKKTGTRATHLHN